MGWLRAQCEGESELKLSAGCSLLGVLPSSAGHSRAENKALALDFASAFSVHILRGSSAFI